MTNNRQVFTTICKAEFVGALETGKEYKAQLTVVNRNSRQAALEIKVNPDQKHANEYIKPELLAKTNLLRASRNSKEELVISVKKLIMPNTMQDSIQQRDGLKLEMDNLYNILMSKMCYPNLQKTENNEMPMAA